MKAVVALLLGVAYGWNKEYTLEEVRAMDTRSSFAAWKVAFEREYENDEEEDERYLTWLDNLYVIASYNSEDLGFKLKMNQFGDMTKDEFKKYVHGDDGACFKKKGLFKENGHFLANRFGVDTVLVDDEEESQPAADGSNPDSVDWTKEGVVTPVKNQGQCGSCWSFSTTGALECNYAIKTGKLVSLSEQQLVDCAGIVYGCEGCNGGQMSGAMKYTANEGGLCSEEEYPYTAKDGTCKATSCGTKYDANTGHYEVTPDNSADLETAVAAGCVSIGIEADQTAFQYYSSGVLTGKCGTQIDHGVLIVGYGTDGDQQYWKVKNSWGETWGESGYVRICRNCDKNNGAGECGILEEPNVPTF